MLKAGKKRSGKSRLGRNKKRYWRSGTNINDVEKHLEHQREDERLGRISEQTNESLFFVHRIGDAIEEMGNQVAATGKFPKSKTISLKCFANLTPASKVPAISKPQPRPKNVKKLKIKPEKISKIAENAEAPKVFDLWAPISGPSCTAKDNFRSLKRRGDSSAIDVPSDVIEYNLKQMRKGPVKIPKTLLKKPSPNSREISVAHPGASYNPSLDDYQELLQNCAATELKKEKEEEKIARKLALPDGVEPATEESRRAELSEGLFGSKDEELGEEGEKGEKAAAPIKKKPISSDDRLTNQQRRMQKQKEATERLRQVEKDKKRFKNELNSVKAIRKEVQKDAEAHQKKLEQRRARKIASQRGKTLRLGKNKFEAPDVEIQLPDELSGSLRLLKPEGNLLADRYKNFQRRNLIEPRTRQKKFRKYKMKKFEKSGHKEIKN